MEMDKVLILELSLINFDTVPTVSPGMSEAQPVNHLFFIYFSKFTF